MDTWTHVQEVVTVKLTESLSDWDDHIPFEELFEGIEETSGLSRTDRYRKIVDSSLLVPMHIAWNDWRARFGISVLLFYLLMAIVWAPMYDRSYMNAAPKLVRPFDWSYTQKVFGVTVWEYPLGTDQFGRPVLQRIVNATPNMIEFIIAGSVVSIGLAVIIGVTAGYKGGTVDDVLMGLTDIFLTIPGLPLVLLIAAVLQPRDPFIIGMILAIDNWPGLARALRSQVLTIREASYVEASRTMGISLGSILGVEIIPQLMPYILVNAANAGKVVIMEAVGLYFLGFLDSGAANWGRMLNRAYEAGAITDLSLLYLIIAPGIALSLLTFGLILLAQGLDQIFNPRLRARHSHSVGGDEEDVENTADV